MKHPTLLFLLLCYSSLFSQQSGPKPVTFGLKAGYAISKLERDSYEEEGIQRKMDFVSRYHAACFLNKARSNRGGWRMDLEWIQKGGKDFFEGNSSFTLYNPEGAGYNFTGYRKSELDIKNTYLNFSWLFYQKVKQVDVAIGFYAGRLIASKAKGNLYFNGTIPRIYLFMPTPGEGETITINSTLNFDYIHDNSPDRSTWTDNEDYHTSSWIEQPLHYPKVTKAYDESKVKKENFYALTDYGISIEIAYYFSRNIFSSLGADLGLKEVGRRRSRFEEKNLTFQCGLGYHF